MISVSVIERPSNPIIREEDAATLAVAFFRACIYDIALCHNDLEEEVLQQWERILRGGSVQDYSISRYFQAIAEAKKRSRNPINTVAYVIYRISHGGHPDVPHAELDEHRDPRARHCIACSAPIDEERRQQMVERIAKGYRIQNVKTPLDCDEIANTHLTQDEIFQFVGHEVSFSYQEKRIQEIYQELERQEARSKL
jgi:hypothetical protein